MLTYTSNTAPGVKKRVTLKILSHASRPEKVLKAIWKKLSFDLCQCTQNAKLYYILMGKLHHFKLIFQKLFSSVIIFALLLAQKFMLRDGGELKCTAMKDLVNFSKITLHCHKIAKCLLRANKRNTNFDHHFRQQIKFSCYFYDFASFITVSLSSVLLRARKMCLNFPKQTKRQTQINCYNNAG